MIGYVTIGVSDMAKASAFYDGLFAELGANIVWARPHQVLQCRPRAAHGCYLHAYDGQPQRRQRQRVGLAGEALILNGSTTKPWSLALAMRVLG